MIDNHTRNLIEQAVGQELISLDLSLQPDGSVIATLLLDEEDADGYDLGFTHHYDKFDVETFGTLNKLVNDFLKNVWLSSWISR